MRQVGRYPGWMVGFSKELKNDVMLRMGNGASYEDRIVIAEHEIVAERVGDFELVVDTPGLSTVTPTALGLSLELKGGQDLGIENRLLACYESADEVVSLTYDHLGNLGNRFVVTRALFSNVGTYDEDMEMEDLLEVSEEELASDVVWESDGIWILDASDVFEAKCSLVACAKNLSNGTLFGGYSRVVRKDDVNSNQLNLFEDVVDESDTVTKDAIDEMFQELINDIRKGEINE